MKALAVSPGVERSAELRDLPPPDPAEGSVLVRGRAVGICGTDQEIVHGGYGEAPAGEDYLVLGHESLGEVVEATRGSGFKPGQLVVGIVRRPDPVPCSQCAIGDWDMCRNGQYRECGIKQQHGYAREQFRADPQFLVPVDPALGEFAVLIEPASVVAKACLQSLHFLQRTAIVPRAALITGAGPIGLLAAMAARHYGLETHVVDIVDSGPKPDLVRAIGAHYHEGSAADVPISPDLVIECTGIGAALRAAIARAAPGAVIALTGISAAPGAEIDLNVLNKDLVLTNKVLFGSVNAARSHYEQAAAVLAGVDPAWLAGLITRRVPFDRWSEALEHQPDDVKVVLEIGPSSQR